MKLKKRLNTISGICIGLLALGCNSGTNAVESTNPIAAAKRIIPLSAVEQARIDDFNAATAALDAGRTDEAEATVDSLLHTATRPNAFLFLLKAQCRHASSDPANALAWYLRALRKEDPHFSTNFVGRVYGPAVDDAVALGRASESDEVASFILNSDYSDLAGYEGDKATLEIPKSAVSPTQRLAYAYLVIALELDSDAPYSQQLEYVAKALALLPEDRCVSVHRAYWLSLRNNKDGDAYTDIDEATTILKAAYQREPVGSQARSDLKAFAHQCSIGSDETAAW